MIDFSEAISARELLLYLLNSGVDIDEEDDSGRTCLYFLLRDSFSFKGSVSAAPILRDAISILIAAGANVFAVDNDGFSVCNEAWDSGFEELWFGVLAEFGYNIADVIQRDEEEGRRDRFFWDFNDEEWKRVPWMEGVFMSRLHEDQTQMPRLTLEDYLQNNDFEYQNLKIGSDDPFLGYWFEIAEDSDSDYETWDEEDDWSNDYEAEEKYTCDESWYYYQHPLQAETYPNRQVERRRLGIVQPRCGYQDSLLGEPECNHQFCWYFEYYREILSEHWLQASRFRNG